MEEFYTEAFISSEYLIFTIIFLTLLISRVKNLAHSTMLGAWLVNFFGTFFHELAHLIASAFLNGKPTKISLLPQKMEGGYTLGYIESSNVTWYNALPISLAPLSLLVLAYYININFFLYFEENTLTYILYIYLQVSLIDSSIPSSQDFKVAFSNIGFIVYFIGAITYLANLYGFIQW